MHTVKSFRVRNIHSGDRPLLQVITQMMCNFAAASRVLLCEKAESIQDETYQLDRGMHTGISYLAFVFSVNPQYFWLTLSLSPRYAVQERPATSLPVVSDPQMLY